jgi:hypothetical protein
MKKLASNLRESARFNQQVSDSGQRSLKRGVLIQPLLLEWYEKVA